MRIEIICTGDEVLTGKIVNSNFSYMSQKLEDVGLSVVWGTTVGDDRERLEEAFRLASGRADAVALKKIRLQIAAGRNRNCGAGADHLLSVTKRKSRCERGRKVTDRQLRCVDASAACNRFAGDDNRHRAADTPLYLSFAAGYLGGSQRGKYHR